VQEACPFRADCYHRRALAKKSRTPPPPRRVQAPRARREPRNRRGLLLVAGAALALLAVAAIAAYFLLGRESKAESVSQAMQEAGCTFRTVEALDPGDHISDPEQTPKEWNTFPPTSGPHFGQWVIWGEYDEPIRLTEAVHNLEHGGIVIWYDAEALDAAAVEQLAGYVRSRNSEGVGGRFKFILTPWGGEDPLPSAVVATAWRYMLQLETADTSAIDGFARAHYGDAPEPNGGPGPPG
jgi:hypothetical protein